MKTVISMWSVAIATMLVGSLLVPQDADKTRTDAKQRWSATGGTALNTFTPVPIDDFASWANQAMVKMSERFEVPTPAWQYVDQIPNVMPYCGKVTIYKDKTIYVYKKGQLGQPIPVEEQAHMLMHGFLHHMEWVRGVSFPPLGHEADYDRWLQTLGMWRRQ